MKSVRTRWRTGAKSPGLLAASAFVPVPMDREDYGGRARGAKAAEAASKRIRIKVVPRKTAAVRRDRRRFSAGAKPARQGVAPAGSNRSGGRGNEAVEAFDGKGPLGTPRTGRPQRE